MATKKKMLQAAAGTAAAGGASLDITDVFSTYLYTGNGSAQVIENGINLGQSFGSGSGEFAGGYVSIPASSDFGFGTGNFTVEMFIYQANTQSEFSGFFSSMNITQGTPASSADVGVMIGTRNNGVLTYDFNSSNGGVASTVTIPNGVWNHIALTRSGSTVNGWLNGSSVLTASSSLDLGTSLGSVIGRFYNNYAGYEFDGKISNVRVVKGTALYTTTFTPPTAQLTAVSGTVLLTMQGTEPFTDNSSSTHSLSANSTVSASTFGPFDAAEAGEGGLVWGKLRAGAAESHWLVDSSRGLGSNGTYLYLSSDLTSAEFNVSGRSVSSFNSNGFTLANGANSQFNASGSSYASWTFRKAPKFFDVVTWTGDGTSARQISHNLGSTPGMILVKITSEFGGWAVYHRGNTANPETQKLRLDNTDATSTHNDYWADTAPTSTHFTIGSDGDVNQNAATYVAYLFAHNNSDGTFGPDGDQDIIKCGSYAGANSALSVDLGWEPQFVMIKKANNTGPWVIADTMRGMNYVSDSLLYANDSIAEEYKAYKHITPTPTGFDVAYANADTTGAGNDFIYMAIRRGPLAPPEAGTEVFEVFETTNTGTASTIGSMGPSDFILNKRTDAAATWRTLDRLRSGSMLRTDSTDSETSASNFLEWDKMGGVFVTAQGAPYITNDEQAHWSWKRAPSYFDVVAYTGTNSAMTLSHNLSAIPEMMWIKNRDISDDWAVYHSGIGNTKTLFLNATNASSTKIYWNNTTPTATQFYLGDHSKVSGAYDYISYLFSTLAGVSKVGSYTGDGTTDGSKVIDCGFTSGARFILIKRSSGTGNWWVWDSVRGIGAGNDPVLGLNLTTSQSYDWLDPDPSGFKVINVNTNNSGDTYIFYAIA